MRAYRKLYFRKKFIECLFIPAVDISTCVHSNQYMVFVGPLGWLAMGNLRCFPSILPLLASIWLTSLNIFTLGGFGCLTPFSLMWVSSSFWGGLNKIGSLFGSFLGLAYLVKMSNYMAVFAICILGWTLLS